MKLLTKWKSFKSQIRDYLKEADGMLLLEHTNLNENISKRIIADIDAWKAKCHAYLRNSFNLVNNEYAHSFFSAKPYGSYIKTENKEGRLKVTQAFEELSTKRKRLEYLLRMMSVSDAIIQPGLIDLNIRAAYSNHEVRDLILDKLYYLYDHTHYPIQTILRGNGILIHESELINMIKGLEKKGYLRAIYSRVLTAQLSIEGKAYIENKRQFKLIDTYIYSECGIEIEAKINNQSDEISYPAYSNDILMSELRDLKSLYHRLNGRNWDELLKGKLVDLESAQMINKEVMNKIYRTMTNEELKFV